MPNSTILIALLILAVIVAFLVPMAKKTENFASSGIDTYDALVGRRDAYIEMGKHKYNKLSDPLDVTRPNFVTSDDPAVIQRVNKDINNALITSEIMAATDEPTFMGVYREPMPEKIPPANGVLAEAKKCEALKTRAACAKLDDPNYKSCGVCIKGGTTYDQQNPGKHIGGLLLLTEDRQITEADAKSSGKAPDYVPTIGACPAGYFHASRAACERAVNRAECSEIGETGGFKGGKTIEGKVAGLEKCAQVPAAGEDVYIYDPKNRKFNVNLRAIAPTGTGITKIFVYDTAGRHIASGIGNNPGKDFIVTIPNTSELADLIVEVEQEVPHRARGQEEVFHYGRNLNGTYETGYNETKDTAAKTCLAIGARLATYTELANSFQKGAQICSCGHTAERSAYPMKEHNIGGCGGQHTINWCGPADWNSYGLARSWCYGVKPPKTTGGAKTMLGTPYHFFNTTGGHPDSPQKDMPNQWSEYGDYQAPADRAIILQWEIADGSNTRIIPFESTIMGVNGMGPTSISSDGFKTFKILRRMGTFAGSAMIAAPRPSKQSNMLTNQFWIWSNQATNQTVKFTTKVPGIFLPPFYAEDAAIGRNGPLIGNPETLSLLRTSPCLKEGQVAGKYSMDCLTNLFVSSGGDIYKGKLATENGGLAQLNKYGDMDKISEYLSGLYDLATTGRDSNGKRVGKTSKERAAAINGAAQLMFGFDITTPCEDVSEDVAGNIVITPKKGAVDADCLDYLWMNTNSDRDRGDEDKARNTSIKNTYTTIGARFSGLRNSESIAATREKFPFQTCQRTGKMAPVGPNGETNVAAMNLANSKGSIQAIQNFYDGIHKAANELGTNKDAMAAHATAMEQCYGISKAPSASAAANCGVNARYVRVLATNVYGSYIHNNCIQIPQIEIFDTNGTEIGKGKKASARSVWPDGVSGPEKAVDGKNYLHGHGSEYHNSCYSGPDNEYWMVDLGKMHQVARIKFYPRTDCCNHRQLAAPVQLLDESRNVVAQKNLGETNYPYAWGQVEELFFRASDTQPEIKLTVNALCSFTTAIAWDRYLRSAGGAIWAHGPDAGQPAVYSDSYKDSATWKLVPALNGRPGYISFSAEQYVNQYLRHAGYRCWLHSYDGSQLFKDDASFKIVPSLNGDPSMVSFQSSNFPNHYITTHREQPGEIWITPITTTNSWDVQRACWKVRKPATML